MNALAKFVEKKYSFVSSTLSTSEGRSFHIAYGTDANYQMGAAISIASILENNKSKAISYHFHIFTDSVSKEYAERLKSIAEPFGASVYLYTIDDSVLDNLPASVVWPLSIYYRILAFDYLYQMSDTLLYLDSDVICKNDIRELEDLELGDNFAAVVPDVEALQKKNQQRLSFDFQNKYFNSGVIYANLKQWNEGHCSDKIFSLIQSEGQTGKLKYPDQDALNIIFFGQLIYLDRKYNAIYPLKSEFERKDKNYYKSFIKDETVFIHYTGITKPWHEWAEYEASIYFRAIYKLTPWKDESYLKSKSTVEYREEYKHCLYQKRYIKALRSLFFYRKNKLLK